MQCLMLHSVAFLIVFSSLTDITVKLFDSIFLSNKLVIFKKLKIAKMLLIVNKAFLTLERLSFLKIVYCGGGRGIHVSRRSSLTSTQLNTIVKKSF